MAAAGIGAFALTDHDTLQGLAEAREEAARQGVVLIPGAEISANFAGQDDVHMLALVVDERDEALHASLSRRQDERRSRGERIARKLIEAGFAIDLDAVREPPADFAVLRRVPARVFDAAGCPRRAPPPGVFRVTPLVRVIALSASAMPDSRESLVHSRCASMPPP